RPAARWCAPRLPAALAVAVGFGALALAATGLGCAGLLFPVLVRLLAAAGLAAGAAIGWRRREDVRAGARAFLALDPAPALALGFGIVLWSALAALPDT